MTELDRCPALNNIPKRKLQSMLDNIEASNEDLKSKNIKSIAINRYAESNIPIEYWNLKMEKDFYGDAKLLNKYNDYIADLNITYNSGKSICFAGNHGIGKTFIITSILKRVCQKGYNALYTDLSSVISVLTQACNEDKFLARKELCEVDFLAIDEVDPRFFSTEAASELYAKNFENIFRTRRQNKLPILICTNSPNVVESFSGNLKHSIGSLFSDGIEIVSVLAEDFRKKKTV
jgi:DNA replication protein DnaC